jgi:hypothetical protein
VVEDVPLWNVVRNDYVAFLLLIGGPAGLVAVAIQGRELSAAERQWGFSLAGGLAAACGVFLARRIARVRGALRHGQRVNGTIGSVWFDSDRGRLDFEYKYGTIRQGGVAINKTRDTEALRVGQQIDLIVSPEAPNRPIVLVLYSSRGFHGIEGANRAFPGRR